MIPRAPVRLDPAFDDPGEVHALLDALAPYPMLQARGQVMSSDLEQATITGAPIREEMIAAAEGDARGSLQLTPTFRGIGRRDLPVWLLVTMRRSGLFERWRIPVATAVCWLYRGPGGTFTYWPDGPDAPPQRTRHPFDNTAVVGENDSMFHRGDPVGAGDRDPPPDLSGNAVLGPAPGDPSRWQVRDGARVLAEYAREEVRFALSWSAQVFRDAARERESLEHRDDLDLETVIDTFLEDLERRGTPVERPADPLHDPRWIAPLGNTYRIVPKLDAPAARA